MKRLWVLCLPIFLSVAACGSSVQPAGDAAWLPPEAPSVSDCPAESRGGDFITPESVLGLAEQWLWVREPSKDIQLLADRAPAEYVSVRVVASAVSGAEIRPAEQQQVRLHGMEAPYVADALERGSDVYMALFMWDGGEERVAYSLITDGRSSPYFAGRCATYSVAEPLRQRLGADYDARVLSLVGKTERKDIEAILTPNTAPTPSSTRDVLGENVETNGLTRVSLVIVPPTGVGVGTDQVLCSRLLRGENECVSLGLLGKASRLTMSAWVGEGEPLSFDFTEPEGYPAVFSFGSVEPDMESIERLESRGGALLVVRLEGDPFTDTQGSASILEVLSAAEVETDKDLRARVFGYYDDSEQG